MKNINMLLLKKVYIMHATYCLGMYMYNVNCK